MTANFTPRLYRHPREKIVRQRISHSPIPSNHYQHGVNNASFVFYTFEHRYKYGKGQISVDSFRYEHHVSVCLDHSPDPPLREREK